jgi:hypothetical protein
MIHEYIRLQFSDKFCLLWTRIESHSHYSGQLHTWSSVPESLRTHTNSGRSYWQCIARPLHENPFYWYVFTVSRIRNHVNAPDLYYRSTWFEPLLRYHLNWLKIFVSLETNVEMEPLNRYSKKVAHIVVLHRNSVPTSEEGAEYFSRNIDEPKGWATRNHGSIPRNGQLFFSSRKSPEWL